MHQANADQNPKEGEKSSSPRRVVFLALESKARQQAEYGKRNQASANDYWCLVVSHHSSDGN